MIPVAVFVPTLPHPDQYACSDYCTRRGYDVHAITSDPRYVAQEYAAGRIAKVVVARPEHLAELITDAEVVTDRPDLDRHDRRTRRVPRSRAGR